MATAFWVAAGAADAACRLALVLALDVSGSVDAEEYALQLNGVATALEDPAVQAALFAEPEAHVALAIIEWSSTAFQRQIQDWTVLAGPPALAKVTGNLRAWQRIKAPEATGIGGALLASDALLGRGPECWKRTVDISGDGKNNDWPLPRDVHAGGALGDTTVNALVIADTSTAGGADGASALAAYFRANVIAGPDAFVELALGYGDYANAMTRKLLRELSSPPLGKLNNQGPVRFADATR